MLILKLMFNKLLILLDFIALLFLSIKVNDILLFSFADYQNLSKIQKARWQKCPRIQLFFPQPWHAGTDLSLFGSWFFILHISSCLYLCGFRRMGLRSGNLLCLCYPNNYRIWRYCSWLVN